MLWTGREARKLTSDPRSEGASENWRMLARDDRRLLNALASEKADVRRLSGGTLPPPVLAKLHPCSDPEIVRESEPRCCGALGPAAAPPGHRLQI